jgi:uncharacterized membrane protein YdjX (TVP38/TMEM64 family)
MLEPVAAPPAPAPAVTASRLRLAAAVAAIVALLALARLSGLGAALHAAVASAGGTGAAGLGVYGFAYFGAALVGLPSVPLTLAGGGLFGWLAAAGIAVPANTVAAVAAFAVGRVIVRDPHRLAARDGRVGAAVRAAGRGGFRLVFLLRLSPVTPFSVLNFAFGATPMSLRAFTAATFLGSIPGAVGFALAGAFLASP